MKKAIALLLALVMCFALVACGAPAKKPAESPAVVPSGKPAGEKPLSIGLSMHNQTETWAVQFKDTFVEYAEAAGYKVSVTDANKDVSAQVGQIEDLVTQGIDALVVLPADYTALGTALKAASDAGVKIINADSKVAEEDQALVSCFITADCYTGGYTIGEYLADKLEKNATIGALNYSQLSVIAVRFDGLAKALADKGRTDVKIIDKDCTDLSAIASYTEDMLMANPEISAFVCLNDNTALSCAGACKQLGHDDILVFGFDGSPAGKQSIAAGEMTGSGVYSPIDLAKASVDAAAKVVKGEKFEKETLVDMWLINPENIKGMDLENWS
ncbi:MAG: sugar ABC transporter substrate-binding protein [Oscillospiraceae bacterium]